jgi:hypothetical protein
MGGSVNTMSPLFRYKLMLVFLCVSIVVGSVTTLFMLSEGNFGTSPYEHGIPEIDERRYVLYPVLEGRCAGTTTRLNATHCLRFLE